MLQPSTRVGASPRYYELDEYTFQDMCRDLFEAEPRIATCDVYGVRGESQFGIDLLAFRTGNDGVEVGQCKCYRDFDPSRIRAASNEFFKYWDEHWSKENVKRFVLFVACTVSNRPRQDEIRIQKRRFAEHQIEYEVWAAPQLTNKLRGNPGIVSSYLKADYWVKELCGTSLPGPAWEASGEPTTTGTALGILYKQFDELASMFSTDAEVQLEEMRQAWRKGEKQRAVDWLTRIRHERWTMLSERVKSRLLTFQGSLALDDDDIEDARSLVEEASTHAITESVGRLRALIAKREGNGAIALSRLDGFEEPDSLNLRAAIHLDSGQVQEGEAILQNLISQEKANAETYRILALACLFTRRLDQARYSIELSTELEPHWVTVRYAAAMIEYFRSISPGGFPQGPIAWPEPVDWSLIKRDEQSQRHLANAAIVFGELANHLQTNLTEQERMQIWRLACLANLPNEQEKAIALCKEILQRNPRCYPAITWTLARNWRISLDASVLALETEVNNESATVSDILALAHCHYSAGHFSEAQILLDRTKPIFRTPPEIAAWEVFFIQVLLKRGQIDVAQSIIQTIDGDHRTDVEVLLLNSRAERDGNWQALGDYLWDHYQQTDNPQSLFGHCEIRARQGKWDEVARLARQLAESVGTGEAARLAITSTFNAGLTQECLDLIDRYADWFGAGRPPRDVRQIRILCLRDLGIVPKAISEAEDLVRDEPSVDNLSSLATLYAAVGDLKKLIPIARRLLADEKAPTTLLVSLATILRAEDIHLSKALCHRLLSEDVPDDLVGSVFRLTLELNVERNERLVQLQQRLFELGRQERGGVHAAEASELREIVRQRKEHVDYLNELYRDGKAPIHLIAEQLGIPLVSIFHSQLEKNKNVPDPINQPILFARHGGRAQIELSDQSALRLNLDITAILLAEHVGILTIVEQEFAPLRIPQSVMAAFLQMEDMLQHHQPNRIKAAREVLRYVQENRIAVFEADPSAEALGEQFQEQLGRSWTTLYGMAASRSGTMCCFLPPRREDLPGETAVLPEEARKRLVGSGAIALALRQSGMITQNSFENAMQGLGSEGQLVEGFGTPEIGSDVYCIGLIAQMFAQSGILSAVCTNFHMIVSRTDVERLQFEVDGFQRAQETLDWLRKVRDRIRQGIESGVYALIPESARTRNRATNIAEPSLVEQCILTLLDFEPGSGDVMWIDDRYVNGHEQRDGVPIIGIHEVLHSLRARNALKERDYYEALHNLRVANVRFLPIYAEEILYHLKQAEVADGRLMEILPLKVIRRYVASCLLQGDMLQRPPVGKPDKTIPNQTGEVLYIADLHRAICQALVAVWSDNGDDVKLGQVYSEWIWSFLFLDLANLRGLAMADTHQDDLYLHAMSFATLLTLGFRLHTENDKFNTRRAFFEWLSNRVLNKKFMVEPTLARAVAGILQTTLTQQMQDSGGRYHREPLRTAAQLVLQKYFDDLPLEIQGELRKDSKFIGQLNLDFRNAIELGDIVFDGSAFVAAAQQAINGHTASVQSIVEPNVWVAFIPSSGNDMQNGFSYVHPITGTQHSVQDDRLALLSDSIAKREDVLRQHPDWIDAPRNEFTRICAEISSTADPEERLYKLNEQMAASGALYYSDLSATVLNRQPFEIADLLPPSATTLLRHHRLVLASTTNHSFLSEIAASTDDLLQASGSIGALERLIGFPVALPASAIDHVRCLSYEDKRRLCHTLLNIMGSPIAKIQGMHVMLHLASDVPSLTRLTRYIATKLLSETGQREFEVFAAILRWANDRFEAWSEMYTWPSSYRIALAWTHANRLFCIFRSAGAPLDWLAGFFAHISMREGTGRQVINPDVVSMTDVCHPHNLSRYRVLLQGFAYAYADNTDLIDDELRLQLTQEINHQPSPDMFRDPGLYRNDLNSFLNTFAKLG